MAWSFCTGIIRVATNQFQQQSMHAELIFFFFKSSDSLTKVNDGLST